MSDDQVYPIYLLIENKPYCIWTSDPEGEALRFLNSYDVEYFRHVFERARREMENAQEVSADISQHAVTNLRLSYHHALECFIALACAIAQAPSAPYAWLIRYNSPQLYSMAELLLSAKNGLTNFLGLSELTWSTLSKEIYSLYGLPEEHIDGFAILWSRFARELFTQRNKDEYNALKHGMRGQGGGVVIHVAPEISPGIRNPQCEPVSLGGSRYGVQWMDLEQIESSISKSKAIDHWVAHRTTNLLPETLLQKLHLVILSLDALLNYGRCYLGDKCKRINIPYLKYMQSPWQTVPSINEFSVVHKFTSKSIFIPSNYEDTIKKIKTIADERRIRRQKPPSQSTNLNDDLTQ